MEVVRHWRLKAQRYRLEGSACPICGQVNFPPRPGCRSCAAQTVHIASYGLQESATSRRTLDTIASKR